MKLKILAVIALGAVGVGAAVFAMGGVSASSASTTEYLTSAATTGDVTDDVAATGTLAASARYGLAFGADPYLVTDTSTAPSSTTTWPVKEVKVKVGDTVAKGDVLATASTTDLRRDLTAAENTLASAQVSLRAAKTTLSDAEDADVTAQVRQAKIGLYNAENQVATARQAVTDLRTQIRGAKLTAPIAGVVTELNVTAGFDAPAGNAVVIDGAGFEVTTDVVEDDLVDVKVGQPATVSVSAVDTDIDGTVSAIAPVASTDSGSGVVSYPVTVTLTDPPATLRSGMSADVTITIASATNVLTVPAAALRGTTGNYSVLLLGADGQPQAQPVDVGLVTNTSAEIKSGLAEGQAVVTGTSSAQTGTPTTGGFGGGIGIPGGGPVRIENGRGNGGNGTNRGGNGN
jgi:membrane fusion protein, macrolide-specific efflux system